MSISLNATFDKATPSINYDALQTFDMAVDTDDEIATPFSYLTADKHPATAFTQHMFELRPDLFGAYAMSLVYGLHSGTAYKADIIYAYFEQYIKYGPKVLHEQLNRKQLGTYDLCPNYLILWAKLMRQTKMTIGFEPVMNKLNNTLNNFFANKKVNIKGVPFDLAAFKPLCYTRAGECYFTILPYLAYLITFMVDCRPYTFAEAHTESSSFGFYTAFENHIQKYYTAFAEDTGVNLLKYSPDLLPATVTDKQLSDMFHKMLHPDRIIEIRNIEIGKTPSLLNECISDQSALSDDYVAKAFANTFTKLIRIIILQNPIKHIFDSIPQFKSDVDINELMNWTSYCLSGGNHPFIIESTIHTNHKNLLKNYTNIRHCDPEKVISYPEELCGKQTLITQIEKLNICKGMPFCENDIVLNMCTAYVKKRYDSKRNDILDEDPISINETMLWHDNVLGKPLSSALRALFLNGIWGYDNTTMATVLSQLYGNPEFVSEVNDLLALGNVTEIAYGNHLGSVIISTYMLSWLNTMVLESIVNGYDLHLLRPYRYLVRATPDIGRITKLCNMVTALCYVSYEKYDRYVNARVREFLEIMESNPTIQQPYVKRLADLADIYAIGGCELYRWATHANPLVRGSMWYYNVFGWSEELENLYLWIWGLDNLALMELLESNLDDTNVMDSTVKVQLTKLKDNKKHPLLLSNYDVDSKLAYKEKSHIYVLDGKALNFPVLSAISRRVFKKSTASSATAENIWFKRIMYKNGEVVARQAFKNSIDIDDKLFPADISDLGIPILAPIYDVIGKVDEVKVIKHTPAGFRAEQLVLGNSRNDKNQVIIIYTKTEAPTRFEGGYTGVPAMNIFGK